MPEAVWKAVIKDMSDRNRTENNRNEDSGEEKLFRAMSGVDEELLLRSEQGGSGNTGKVHKFPTRYVSRIAAACLCFAVAGVLYAAMSSTKMADSTGSADTAAPQLVNSITADTAIPEGNETAQAEQYAAAQAEDAGDDGSMDGATMPEAAAELPGSAVEEAKPESAKSQAASELPEEALEEAASELPESAKSEAADNEMPVTQQDSGAQGKQDSQMSTEDAASGGTDEMSETDTTAAAQEGKIMKKQGRHFPGKLTKKGQQ